jgi:hypothetical protein
MKKFSICCLGKYNNTEMNRSYIASRFACESKETQGSLMIYDEDAEANNDKIWISRKAMQGIG